MMSWTSASTSLSTLAHPLAQASESTSISPSHGPPYQVMEEPRGPFLSLYSGGAALDGGIAPGREEGGDGRAGVLLRGRARGQV